MQREKKRGKEDDLYAGSRDANHRETGPGAGSSIQDGRRDALSLSRFAFIFNFGITRHLT